MSCPQYLRLAPIVLLLLLAGCGGEVGGGVGSEGGGNSGGSNNSIAVRGRVFDASGASDVPLAGVTVTLRDESHTPLSSATSAGDGTYTLVNVPASRKVFISTGKAGYVNCNSRIFSLSANSRVSLIIVSESAAKRTADAMNGSVGASSWNDAFYSGKSWFGMNYRNISGNEIPGLEIHSTPGNASIKYNNGSDSFSATPPTTSSIAQPLVGGFSAATGNYTFVTNFFQTVELPLIQGEMGYSFNSSIARSLVWGSAKSGTNNALFGIASSGSSAVAVGALGTILTSSDGISFTPGFSNVAANLNGIATSGAEFVAVGDSGTIATSSDLVTWTQRTSGTTNRLRGVAWTGSQYLAVGDSGTILASPDAASWTIRTSGTTNDLYGVAGNGTQNVAVGDGWTLLTSPTGSEWTPRASQGGKVLRSVVWTGAQFLIAGDWPSLQTSFDGISWMSRQAAMGGTMNAAAWSGAQFFAVGEGGSGQKSPDGISWTRVPPAGTLLNGVTWFKSEFLAVGMYGGIFALR